MRRVVAAVLASIMCLMCFAFCGCAKTNQRDTKKATDFLTSMYSVSDKEIENYNTTYKAGAAPQSEIAKISDKVKPYMTDEAFKKLLQNNTYRDIVKNAAKKKCSLSNTTATLNEDSSGDGYVQYSYTVNFTVKDKDGNELTKTEQGVIQTNSQNGKVSYIQRTVVADTLNDSEN